MLKITGINEKKGKNYIIGFLYMLYAFMGAFGTVMSFASCFSLGKEIEFYLVPIVLTVAVCMLFFIERIGVKALLVMFLGIGAFVYVRIKDVVGSVVTIANIVINDVNESYMMGLAYIEYPEYVMEYRDVDLFLIIAILVITILICYFVMGHASVVGCIIVSVPFTIFGIFFDIFPQRAYLVMAVMFWAVAATLRASGRQGRCKSDVAAVNALLMIIMVGVSVVIGQKVTPESEYSRDDRLKEIKVFINDRIYEITSTVPETNNNESGVGDGSFGNRDKITFSGRKMLEAEVPLLEENIYIRAREYNEYTGNGWDNNKVWFGNYFGDIYEEKEYDKWPQNISNEIVKGFEGVLGVYGVEPGEYVDMTQTYSVKVKNVAEQFYSFVPYGAVVSGNLEQDFIPKEAKNNPVNYEVYSANAERFIEAFGGGLSDNYYDVIQNSSMVDEELKEVLELEKTYAAYVRKAYTQVPEGLMGTLSKYAPEMVEYNYQDTMEFVREIQRMFAYDFQYSLEPGRVPMGEDGVEYFLEENRKGYCAYFASAATMIFRMAGIPARYVEGYVITPDMASINQKHNVYIMRTIGDESFRVVNEYVTVTVPDNKAHAWTEIYIEGYGWIPIEVTPGYHTEIISVPDDKEQETQEETTTRKEQESQTEKNTSDNEQEQRVETDWEAIGKMCLILFMMAVLATTLIFGVRYWYLSGKKRLSQIFYGDNNISNQKRACLVWWYMERVMDFIKKPIPENISCEKHKEFLKENTEFFSKNDLNGTIDYIIKAYYGNENITNEEVTKIGEMAVAFRTQVYESLSGIERFRFKYLKRL